MKSSNPNDFAKIFDKKFKAVSKNVDESLLEIGERGVNYLKIEANIFQKPTGRLKNSSSYTVDKRVYKPLSPFEADDTLKPTTEKETVYIGTNVVYAPSVEYLAKNGSQGYMFRAYKALKRVVPKIMRAGMKEGMRK